MAKITFEEYQQLSARTANGHEDEIVNYAMGLDGEIGELVDAVKKFLFHGHNIDKDYIKKEAGDVLWYASQLLRIYRIRTENIFDKLNSENETIELVMEQGKNPRRVMMISCLSLAKASGKVSQFVDETYLGHVYGSVSIIKQALDIVLRNVHFIIRIAGLTIEEVAEANIAKLKARYPEGFSAEASINRVEEE